MPADLLAELGDARRGLFTIATRRGSPEALRLDAAYRFAAELEREQTAAGWQPVGWKVGFTNQSLWGKLGLDRPIRARIYRETLAGGVLESAALVQPRIEPEIVVGIGADLPPGSGTEAIARSVEWVAAGLEVVQCHFADWEMSPAEAVADAGVHAALAVGPRREVDPDRLRSLAGATCELSADGITVATGRGADVLGGPLESLEWLFRGLPTGLRAGEIVTTGTLTEALPVVPRQRWKNRLTTEIGLEPVELTFR